MRGDTVRLRSYASPCGTLLLGSWGDRLCLCDWVDGQKHARTLRRLGQRLRCRFEAGESAVARQAAEELDEYFHGRRREFGVPLLTCGTEFQKTVWAALPMISYGTTDSYGRLAATIGLPRAVRAVANAVAANALSVFLPCHRIVGDRRRLTGYNGGLPAKRFLLELEAGHPSDVPFPTTPAARIRKNP